MTIAGETGGVSMVKAKLWRRRTTTLLPQSMEMSPKFFSGDSSSTCASLVVFTHSFWAPNSQNGLKGFIAPTIELLTAKERILHKVSPKFDTPTDLESTCSVRFYLDSSSTCLCT